MYFEIRPEVRFFVYFAHCRGPSPVMIVYAFFSHGLGADSALHGRHDRQRGGIRRQGRVRQIHDLPRVGSGGVRRLFWDKVCLVFYRTNGSLVVTAC